MVYKIGSARQDENGRYYGGKAGDQTGKEVSQQNLYNHKKGWVAYRAKSNQIANCLKNLMIAACNNANLGYDQHQRLGVIKNGIYSKVKTECDCSSLVRACIKEASGIDPGNFTTANAGTMILATGLFDKIGKVTTHSNIYEGDILCTATKGHIVICTEGFKRFTYKCPYSEPITNVAYGAKGEPVYWVEYMLNATEMGYKMPVSGFYTMLVKGAVIDFQKKTGLGVDGVVGPITKDKLIELVFKQQNN